MKTGTKRSVILSSLPLLALGAMMIPGSACDKIEEVQGAVCCDADDFQVGGTISAKIGGGAQAQVAVQAIADLAGVASVMVDDLTVACRNIAQDLDAPEDKQKEADAKENKRDKVKAWCELAVAQIGSFKGSAKLTIKVDPPKCEASVSAKASCQGSCSAEASCDIKANPPTCEGGSLEVACKGECTAKAGASLKCEGSCGGECKGSCEAQGGVKCAGKCEGTCEGDGSAGNEGIQADGTCKGTCKGTCEVTAPGASCTGSCKGECKGSCTGSAEASVKCDGECKADFEPLKCTGGELKGGCQVDAKCEANCDASVKAKAECKPPAVVIDFQAAADAKLNKLKATLEANLGFIYGAEAKVKGLVDISGTLSGNVSGLVEIKAACLPAVAKAIDGAVTDIGVSVQVTGSIVGSIK
ncbi:MAG TPA: hypothetical protein PK140_10415 [Polyangiaceae bacterium]|nr:hypothetical protein [Polyangiaceae bacterium]HQM09800.1 hypothetical protein [Polyangiaceae bacterium]